MTHLSIRRATGYVVTAAAAWGTGGAAGALLFTAGGLDALDVTFWRFLLGAAFLLPLLVTWRPDRRTSARSVTRRPDRNRPAGDVTRRADRRTSAGEVIRRPDRNRSAGDVTRRPDVHTPAGALTWRPDGHLLVVGAGMAVYQAAYFAAIARSGVAVATVITMGATPVFTALGGRLFLGERLGRAGLAALLTALTGLTLLLAGTPETAPLGTSTARVTSGPTPQPENRPGDTPTEPGASALGEARVGMGAFNGDAPAGEARAEMGAYNGDAPERAGAGVMGSAPGSASVGVPAGAGVRVMGEAPVAVGGSAFEVLSRAEGSAAGDAVGGAGFALLSAFGYAGVTLLSRRRGAAQGSPVVTAAAGFLVGAACLLPFALAGGVLPRVSWESAALLAFLGAVPTALAYGLFFRALTALSATTVAIVSLGEAAFAALIGVALLGERPGPAGWAGCALLLLAGLIPAVRARD